MYFAHDLPVVWSPTLRVDDSSRANALERSPEAESTNALDLGDRESPSMEKSLI